MFVFSPTSLLMYLEDTFQSGFGEDLQSIEEKGSKVRK